MIWKKFNQALKHDPTSIFIFRKILNQSWDPITKFLKLNSQRLLHPSNISPGHSKDNNKAADPIRVKLTSFTLPDGQEVSLEPQFFQKLEKDFFINSSVEVQDTISQINEDSLGYYDEKIFLQGGMTNFSGFEQALDVFISEQDYYSSDFRVVQRSLDEKKFSGWLGGSVYSCLNLPSHFWISKQDYMEIGENVLFRKIIN